MNKLGILLMSSPEGTGDGGGIQTLLMFGLIFIVFYFFMIRPQVKKQKEQKKFREALSKGDRIVTIGGIHGKIVELKEDTAIIEVEGGTRIEIEKSAIAQEFSSEEMTQK